MKGKAVKVAMLTTAGDRCGIAAYSRELLAALSGIVDVDVTTIEPGKQSLEHYREQASRLNAADVVHIQHEHSFWGGILPNQSGFWNLRYLVQKPVVVTAHTTTSLADLLRLKQERRLPHRLAKELLVRRGGYRDSVEIAPFITGHCIVHTEEGRADLVARGANPKYVHVIPAGIPEAVAATSPDAFRARFGLENRRIVSLFGYIAPNKGYEVMLDAMRSLPDETVLLIAGGARSDDMAAYAAGLRAQIQDRGLGGRAVITDYLSEPEVATAMAVSDIVVAPHTYATGSYSITVPLAYGKAIVASDQACFREIERDGQCLKIVPTGDSEALAAAVLNLLVDPAAREKLEVRAKAFAEARTWPSVARQTVEVYREAIEDVSRLSHHGHEAVRR